MTTLADGAETLPAPDPAPSIVPPEALASALALEHGSAPSLTPEQELHAYRQMLLIRRSEEKAGQLYGMGLIGGFCHLYIGQEAVVTGMEMARGEGDQVITAYRDHGHMLSSGMDPKGVMAELTGRRHGYSKGKGGSMHMFSVAKNFYGGHGIVGSPAPLGTGLAFANKYRGNDRVCLTFFGEGATNQGQVYESFNMASLWKLPVVYVIENNHYAMGTLVERASALAEELYHRGSAFGIPGIQVDGMDVRAVKAAGEEAIAQVRGRRRADDPRDAHLSLSRSFHVRSRQISDPRGGPGNAHATRPHRAVGQAHDRGWYRRRGPAQADRQGHSRHRCNELPNLPPTIPSRSLTSSIPTWSHALRTEPDTRCPPKF